MKFMRTIVPITILSICLILAAFPVHAQFGRDLYQNNRDTQNSQPNQDSSTSGDNGTQNIICKNVPGQQCESADESTLDKLVSRIVNPLLFVAGALAVLMLIIGGMRFVTSAGNQERIQGARNNIIYAVVGLLVVILAFAIVNFVLKRLF